MHLFFQTFTDPNLGECFVDGDGWEGLEEFPKFIENWELNLGLYQ
jgi:hypothetical protein